MSPLFRKLHAHEIRSFMKHERFTETRKVSTWKRKSNCKLKSFSLEGFARNRVERYIGRGYKIHLGVTRFWYVFINQYAVNSVTLSTIAAVHYWHIINELRWCGYMRTYYAACICNNKYTGRYCKNIFISVRIKFLFASADIYIFIGI